MVPASPLRRALSLSVLGAGAALLWATRPHFDPIVPGDPQNASCLANLSAISRALSLYARDFDAKIPLAVDPEDRFNSKIWLPRFPDAPDDPLNSYAHYVQTAPFLHVVLRPYLDSPGRFHCPSDVGWKVSRLAQFDPDTGQPQGLMDVHPSSFAKYGTSYYSWTRYGFDLQTVADVPEPSRRVLLFDGDLWHRAGNRELAGELFLDGHAALLSHAQHEAATPAREP